MVEIVSLTNPPIKDPLDHAIFDALKKEISQNLTQVEYTEYMNKGDDELEEDFRRSSKELEDVRKFSDGIQRFSEIDSTTEFENFINKIREKRVEITVSIVRHPQSVGQLFPYNQRVSGQTPEYNVTEKGKTQGDLLLLRFLKEQGELMDLNKDQEQNAIRFHRIYTSLANRTGYLGELLARDMEIRDLMIDNDLAEIDKNGWSGMLRDPIYKNEKIIKIMKELGSDFRHGLGETEREVIIRINNFLNDTLLPEICFSPLSHIIESGENIRIGLMTHQGTIKAMLKGIVRSNENLEDIDGKELHNTEIMFNGKKIKINDLHIENTSITEIAFDGEKWIVRLIGDTTHLENETRLIMFEKPIAQRGLLAAE